MKPNHYLLLGFALLWPGVLPAQQLSQFEYWFNNNTVRNTQSISGSEAYINTDIDAGGLNDGIHFLHFRVKNTDGTYSGVSSACFLKYAVGLSNRLEYWYNDDFNNRKTQYIPNGNDVNVVTELDVRDMPFGLNRFCFRASANGFTFSPVQTSYVLKLAAGTATNLEYWFDDDIGNCRQLTSGASTDELTFVADIDAGTLSNGLHTVHFRSRSNSGYTASQVTSAVFLKGVNIYGGGSEPKPQVITDYLYWFDNLAETDVRQAIEPVDDYTFDQNVAMPAAITQGKHVFNIKFKDNYGQWSETATDTFRSTVGLPSKAYIKNLEPNINPTSYDVKDLATIYRYYRIEDENNSPIQGAVIDYLVDATVFHSLPSDAEGLTIIEFPVWGKDVNDKSDDYIQNTIPRQMRFVGLKDSLNRTLDVPDSDNAFLFSPTISVYPYQSDEFTLTFEAGGKVSAGIDSKLDYVDAKISGSANASISFTSVLNPDGTISEMSYGFSAGVKGSGGLNIKKNKELDWLSFQPKLGLSGSLESSLSLRGKGEITFDNNLKSYLMVLYDLLSVEFEASGYTNKTVNAIMNMIGNYLQDATPPSSKLEASFGGYVKGNGHFGLGIDNKLEWMKVYNKGFNLSADINGKMGFDFTLYGNKYSNYQNINYNWLKYSIEGEVGIEGNYVKALKNFGVGYSTAAVSSVKYGREYYADNDWIKKATVDINQGNTTEYKLDWSYLPVNVMIITGKSYNYRYSIDEPVFDYVRKHPNLISSDDVIWNYFNNQYVSMVLRRDKEFYLDGIVSKMKQIDFTDNLKMNKSFSSFTSKNYAVSLEIEKEIGFDSKWLGLDWKASISGKGEMDGQYPMEEAFYHPVTQQFMPVVKYEDIEKSEYYLSPFIGMNSIWEGIASAVNNFREVIIDKAKQFWGDVVAFFDPFDKTGKKLSNGENRHAFRNYSKSLVKYDYLRSYAQTDISVMEFLLPGNNQAFEDNTEVRLKYYYPGGELLGATVDKDTFIVISDVFFLSAIHDKDTLKRSPLGNFKVYATVGNDDLDFLGISKSYPVSIYFSNLEGVWERIGAINDSITFDEMGTYCLGISVNADKEPPLIDIKKSDNANTLEVTVTDNMAVYWKNVYVIVNGMLVECLRNGNKLVATLTEEQMSDDIYVTVYASDLARNEVQASEVFKAPTGIQLPITSDLKLYPNPAIEVCHLQVSGQLQINKFVKYAIVSPQGQVLIKDVIHNEITDIKIGNLAKGVYFVVVHDENHIIGNLKLIKK